MATIKDLFLAFYSKDKLRLLFCVFRKVMGLFCTQLKNIHSLKKAGNPFKTICYIVCVSTVCK